jgi:ABC-2 type transport system permease protein
MRADDVWTIAAKDLRTVWAHKGIRYGLSAFPMVAAIGLPQVIGYATSRNSDLAPSVIEGFLQSFMFFFMIAVTTLPTAIASYSLVGEKVERSLEPMLATPVSVGSVLLGKTIAAVLPTLAAVWAACGVFMVLADRAATPLLGYRYFPQSSTWVQLLVLMPLVALFTVNIDIVVSSRVADVRSAQQIAGLVVLPVSALYMAAQLGSVTLNTTMLWRMSAGAAVLAAVAWWVARRVFNREEILTRWT